MRPIDADKLWESVELQLNRAKEIADGDDLLDLIVDVISAGFKQEIDNAPTVDAEPVKHGYWIKHFDDIWPSESTWECSLCHEEQGYAMLDTNYCPNCGAKMDEKEDTDG